MRQQLEDLRNRMKNSGIDVYIVSDKDEHLSESTGAHFSALKEFSGFFISIRYTFISNISGISFLN